MTPDLFIGLFYFVMALTHGFWTLSASIRAYKHQWPVQWPVSGRWVLVCYSGSLTLFLFDICRLRWTGATAADNWWVMSIRGLAALMTLWAMWRWLSGNLAFNQEGGR